MEAVQASSDRKTHAHTPLTVTCPPQRVLCSHLYHSHSRALQPIPVVMASQSPSPSWATIYHEPPAVKYPYNPKDALADLPGVSYALELFLSSHMVESEDYCHKSDDAKERLYFTTGYGLIQCVKGLMSYADEDLLAGIHHTRHGNHVASLHRKKAGFFGSILGSAGLSSSSSFIKSMTDVERHAELVYAESLFEKALLGIVYSGDWLAFIKEALNMRTTIGIYRQLGAFLDDADAAYAASATPTTPSSTASSITASTTTSASTPPTSLSLSSPHTPTAKAPRLEDPSIDPHFRSGVLLGVGLCNIILSLMPGKLATLVELFGYKGDRALGLDLLLRAGGWDGEVGPEPRIGTGEEGVRRTICDMALLIFHLVLSSFTVEGVDVSVAGRILEWNLKRYPNGVFFLFGAGRLSLHRSQPRQAIAYYTKAMASQVQYRNLHHISFWEIAVARLALWEVGEEVVKGGGVELEGKEKEEGKEEVEVEVEVGGSAACWRVLEKEATWSKSIYSYGLAACLLQDWDTDEEDTAAGRKKKAERLKEAAGFMARVPGLRQKIAGKSIPLEKFVARKARKFASQKNRLLLPALEVAYLFQAIAHAPRTVILRKMLPLVRAALAKLALYGEGTGVQVEGTGVTLPVEGTGVPLLMGTGEVESAALGDSRKDKDKDTGRGKKGKGKGKGKKKLGVDKYEGGAAEYWDDLCLARFLEGVCLRFIAYPDPDAVLDPEETITMPKEEAEKGAEEAFGAVFEYGPKIELDHHLVYHAHYELGRLLACQGKVEEAKTEFELLVSGKYLEVGPSGRRGKYSMENALHMRAHAALDALLNSHSQFRCHRA
ncbi:hypothetical protein D9615_010361 [Tricholomella constricta]|uniref:Uncharacterized protein n=1 Tax=Tricholomella constricta TaxID=117010 RepID=A0A8H5GNK2_9AGAR|nr:hypothetical protein D9615_010361 [Tricholomella constricta]